MLKTCDNGSLNLTNLSQEVQLVGWVSKTRNFGSILFVDLRDRTGLVQLVIDLNQFEDASSLKSEYLIQVKGLVSKRKDPNPSLKTGEIEILVSDFTLINRSKLPPMLIQDKTDALEELRLKYRYLDLRRPIMQERLFKRAKIVSAMRRFLDDHGFIDVETPMLTKSTPEGAREYLVPSRVHAGEFYALAQSPQIFKQLLMIAGFERYYQVARCFRDEDLRADRQLDFTQVDIETSFLSEEEFQSLMEDLCKYVFKEVLGVDLKTPFLRMPFDEALNRFGSDKPDTRFDLELIDLTSVLQDTEFALFKGKETIKALVLKDVLSTRKESDVYSVLIKKLGGDNLVVFKLEDGELTGSAVKFLSEDQVGKIKALSDGPATIFVSAGKWEATCVAMGGLRLELRDKYNLVQDENQFNFLWLVDFPMFEEDPESDLLLARHHPFTRPKIQSIDELYGSKEDLLKLKAVAYDLVLNGNEVAGGSMRIYDGDIQERFFEIIGFTKEEIKDRFGFFIDAFDYGTPPHGGMAFGLDRFAMLLTGGKTIRDVIAFPKNASARDPLTNAPSPITDRQLRDLHLEINKKKED